MRSGSLLLLLAVLLPSCDGSQPATPPPGDGGPPAQPPSTGRGEPGTEDGADAPPTTPDVTTAQAAPTEPARSWLDTRGTSLLGFGILRLIPAAEGPSRFRIHYEEEAGTYSTTDNLQLFVLPADSFARSEMAYAHQLLAFTRTVPAAPAQGGESGDAGYYGDGARLSCQIELTADAECTLIVGYGPWTGPDTGRPPGDEPTFRLEVTSLPGSEGAAHEWVESEAGELITTNWTGRPGVARGEPCFDPIGRENIWIEIRPLILYDARLARSQEEAPDVDLPGMPEAQALLSEAERLKEAGRHALATDRSERAADLIAAATRRDHRIVLTPRLTEKFRRVPIRWR